MRNLREQRPTSDGLLERLQGQAGRSSLGSPRILWKALHSVVSTISTTLHSVASE